MEIGYDSSTNKALVPGLIGRYESESEDEDNNAMVLEDAYMLAKISLYETKQPMAKARAVVIFTLEDNMGKRKAKRISRIAGHG